MEKHTITREEYEAAKDLAKQNQNKRVDKRLQVIILRYEGMKDREIAVKLDYDRKRISQLCAEFKRVGVEEYARHKYGGNHRNMTDAAEKEFLDKFEASAKGGQLITITEMAAAYDKATGKAHASNSSVYNLLHKHGWRIILLVLDNAAWHKSKSLAIPDNIYLFYLPPRTPEMNPIEQIWKEIRKRGFKNTLFKSLDAVVDRLCDTCNSLTNECVKSITGRTWIRAMF